VVHNSGDFVNTLSRYKKNVIDLKINPEEKQKIIGWDWYPFPGKLRPFSVYAFPVNRPDGPK